MDKISKLTQALYKEIYPEQNRFNIPQGYTLAEIGFRDMNSNIPVFEVDLTSHLGNIEMPFPLFSSAMDTLCGSRLAIALSEMGGCGILYRTKDPEKQMEWIKEVISHKPGLIEKPVCVHPNDPLEKADEILNKKKFSTIPVVAKKDNKLKGLLFTGDISFEGRLTEKTKKWMTPLDKLKVESYKTSYERISDRLLNEQNCSVLPTVDEKGKLKGLYFMKDVRSLNPSFNSEGKPLLGIAIGPGEKDVERVAKAKDLGVQVFVIDSSHGNCQPVIDQVIRVKKILSEKDLLIVGNIANIDGYLRLAEAGADAVKNGIGSGSICTTSYVTGVGSPMFSLILELDYAREYLLKEGKNAPFIIPDGGINGPGDMTRALAAGGNACMAGKWLVACDESLAEEEKDGYIAYRGMASPEAIKKRVSSSRYGKEKTAPEGISGLVPNRGKLRDWLPQDIELIKGGFAHAGAFDLTDLQQITNENPYFFTRFGPAGMDQIKTRVD